MSRELAAFAVWAGLDHLSIDEALDFARRVEAAGYGAFWTRESTGREPFSLLARLAVAAPGLTFGTGIANVHARDAVAMKAAAATLHEITGGRSILGLGVGHKASVEQVRGGTYGRPLEVMGRYLEAYAAAPYRVVTPFGSPPVVIAALRPRMVELAGRASDGALPYLVPARSIKGFRTRLDDAAAKAGRPRPLLVVSQAVVLESDPDRARAAAAGYVRTYLGMPAYVASLLALGYDAADLEPGPSTRLLDELVLWGDTSSIRERLRGILAAGADQVGVIPLDPAGVPGHIETAEAVAPLLGR